MKAGNHENLIFDIFHALEYFSKQDATYSLAICNSLANALANIYFNIFENAVIETFNQKIHLFKISCFISMRIIPSQFH